MEILEFINKLFKESNALKQKTIYFTGAIVGAFLTAIISVNILGYNIFEDTGANMDITGLILLETLAVIGCLMGGAISIRIYKKLKP